MNHNAVGAYLYSDSNVLRTGTEGQLEQRYVQDLIQRRCADDRRGSFSQLISSRASRVRTRS